MQDLPFGDESFDVVAALWMLYHVADVDKALAQIRRVLRPGGLFVAVTNGDGHLADLRREAGGDAEVTGFSTQNGEAQLRAHFTEVVLGATSSRGPCSPTAPSRRRTSGRPVRTLTGRCRRSTSRASTPARPRSSAAADPPTPTLPARPGSVAGGRGQRGGSAAATRSTDPRASEAAGRRRSRDGQDRLLGDRLRDVAGHVGGGGTDEELALAQRGQPHDPVALARSARRRRPWRASTPCPWSRP